MSGYAILAQRRTTIGEGEGGYSDLISNIFSTAGRGVSSLVEKKQASDAAAKYTKDSAAALQTVLVADQTAKNALARALVSEEMKTGSAPADRAASDLANQAADVAAQGLSPELQKKRADAAQAALATATKEWQTASAGGNTGTTKVKELWVRAAATIFAKTQNAMIVRAADLPGGLAQQQAEMSRPSSQSWFTRPVLGPIPGIGVVGGLAAIAGLVVLVMRKAGV